MKVLSRFVLPFLLLVLPVATPRAAADPLRIASGFLTLDNRPDASFGVDFGLSGAGFIFVGEAPWSAEFLEGFFCTTCSPKSIMSPFRLQFSPTQVIDPSSNSSCPGCGYDGDFTFEFASSPIQDSLTLPFSMNGTLAGFLSGSSVPVFQSRLSGSGTMFASTEFVRFDFARDAAPVPEPSTLLLIGSGLALAARRCRQLRTRRRTV